MHNYERDSVQAHVSFIQYKSLEIKYIMEVSFFSWFDIGINFKDFKVVHSRSFEMS